MNWKLLALLYFILHPSYGCKTTENSSVRNTEMKPLSELSVNISCRQMAEIFDYFSGQFGSFFCSKEQGEVISPEVTDLKMLGQDGSAAVKKLLKSLLQQRTALLSDDAGASHQASRTISKSFIQIKDQNPCYTPWNLRGITSESKGSKTSSKKSKCPDSAALIKKVMQSLR